MTPQETQQTDTEYAAFLMRCRLYARAGYGWEDIAAKLDAKSAVTRGIIRNIVLRREPK